MSRKRFLVVTSGVMLGAFGLSAAAAYRSLATKEWCSASMHINWFGSADKMVDGAETVVLATAVNVQPGEPIAIGDGLEIPTQLVEFEVDTGLKGEEDGARITVRREGGGVDAPDVETAFDHDGGDFVVGDQYLLFLIRADDPSYYHQMNAQARYHVFWDWWEWDYLLEAIAQADPSDPVVAAFNQESLMESLSLIGTYVANGVNEGTERITNGGLEGSSSPWARSSFWWTDNGGYPHSGTGYLYGGAADNVSGTASQQVTVPSDGATLSFWINVTSEEATTTTEYDVMEVEVTSPSGELLGTLDRWSNLDKGTAGSYSHQKYNLGAWAGQTVLVQFRVNTDYSLISRFRIDDVSVK